MIVAVSLLLADSSSAFPTRRRPNRQPPPFRPWRVSGGIIYRNINGVTFSRDPAMVSAEDLVPSGIFQNGTLSAGSESQYANRQYDDGFVRTSPPTGSTGWTWYWGYNNSAQVSGDSLLFHGAYGSETVFNSDSAAGAAEWNAGSMGAQGFMIRLERDFRSRTRRPLWYGLETSISFITKSINGNSVFENVQGWDTYNVFVEDRYDLNGVKPPRAPYSGSFGGPGPLIANKPSGRSLVRGDLIASGAYDLQTIEKLKLDLITLSLGANCSYKIDFCRFMVGGGLTLNVVSTDASHEERLFDNSWSLLKTSSSEAAVTEVQVGGYIAGCAGIEPWERLRIDLFGRLEVVDTLTGNVGPTQFDVDLTGYSAGCALTWAL